MMNGKQTGWRRLGRWMLGVAAMGWFATGSMAQTPAPAKAPIQLGPSCVTTECHGDLKKTQFTHGPVNLNQCAPCHEPVENKHVFKKREGAPRELCLVCHQDEAKKASVHPPFAADCTMCHDPHGGENRLFVKGGLGAEGCAQCHSDVRAGLTELHGPVALGECLVCHSAHQSDHPKLLVESRKELCLSCHIDTQQEMQAAVSVHEPVANCTGCHNAHGGSKQYFLTDEAPKLCRDCHGDFLKEVDALKFPHQPMTEGKSCVQCHKPHASNQERLLEENNMQLCLSCHDKAVEAKSRTLANVAGQIENAKFLHGPIRENNCIACHDAHGSDNANILDLPFPSNFYAPFNETAYDLCFHCHDRVLVQQEQSTATGFRNGEENLHYLHVNREKGRSCRACHQEHASNQPKHIRSEVPFGRWVMKLDYTKTDTGGGCATGCHLPYQYDRDTPVKNTKVAAQ